MTSKPINLTDGANDGGAEIKTLTMRVPRVRDTTAADKTHPKDGAAMEIQLFANLCEVNFDCIEGLSMRDYGKLQSAYKDFLKD